MTFIYLDFSFFAEARQRARMVSWSKNGSFNFNNSFSHWVDGDGQVGNIYVWCKFCRFCSWLFKPSVLSNKSLEQTNVVIIYWCPNIMLCYITRNIWTNPCYIGKWRCGGFQSKDQMWFFDGQSRWWEVWRLRLLLNSRPYLWINFESPSAL